MAPRSVCTNRKEGNTMKPDAVKPLACPNRECSHADEFECESTGPHDWNVICFSCGYRGPNANSPSEAIRLHNLICAPPAGFAPTDYPEVIKFAEAMLFKLRENSHKDGGSWRRQHGMRSWKGCDPSFLTAKLREEIAEFKLELTRMRRGFKTANDVNLLHEAADVANIVMMLVDNCGTLTPEAAPENDDA
jgi:hypothetical protein